MPPKKEGSEGFGTLIPVEVLLENMQREIKDGEQFVEAHKEEVAEYIELGVKEAEDGDRSMLDAAIVKRDALKDLEARITEVRGVSEEIKKMLAKKEDVKEEKRAALASYQALQRAYKRASSLLVPDVGG